MALLKKKDKEFFKMSKKIAVIASSIHPFRQKHLLEWHEDFSKENFTTQLFLGSRDRRIPKAVNYKVNSKSEKFKYAILNFFEFKEKSNELKRVQPLVNYNPDIIHLLTSNVFVYIEPTLDNKSNKLIVSFRGFDINVFPNQSEENKLLTQRIFQRADLLHFISENLMNTAISLGAKPSKCRVIHRSIRTASESEFKRENSKNGKLIILSVGRLVWEKGYLYALETIAILKSQGYNFEYQIAGKGIDYNMLVYHSKRLDIQDKVRFFGELSRDEVREKLISADIYFQPSLTEALSLAIIEASYYGLPVVSSNIGGIPEVVSDTISGFLSSPCEPSEYAKNIIKLFENPELRIQMGKNGHNRIINNFSRTKEIEKWCELYCSI